MTDLSGIELREKLRAMDHEALVSRCALVLAERDAAKDQVADLMTIIDFCDAMGRDNGGPAIHAAHELAHALTDDPDREIEGWRLLFILLGYGDEDTRFGPAWADVRRSALDVLARVPR